MRVVINAISVKEGGAKVVLEKLVSGLLNRHPDWTLEVIASEGLEWTLLHPSLTIFRFGWAERSFPRIAGWYAFFLPIWLFRRGADVLFSVTNYLPPYVAVPALLLEQNASYFCDLFFLEGKPGFLGRLGWRVKKAWVIMSLRTADRVTVQTRALAGAMSRVVPGLAARIAVVPHGPGQAEGRSVPYREPLLGDRLEIGYVTTYGDQKNFRVLFDALKRLGATRDFRLHLTLDPADPGTALVSEMIEQSGLGDRTVNHGELDAPRLAALYDALHLFVFPSICESFGFPLVEALAHELPVLASDTPSNRELCGFAAGYFDVSDGAELAQCIGELAGEAGRLAAASRASALRRTAHSWDEAVIGTSSLISTTAGKQAS